MKTSVEKRMPQAGYVYVNDTRMTFAPGYTERDLVLPENALVLREANWRTPNRSEVRACQKALKKIYPERPVIVLGSSE